MIITIDGNIGAGKSTLLTHLQKTYKYDIHLEPIDEWIPFLKDMYENSKDAFEFQVKVWNDRCFTPYYSPHTMTCVERSPYFQWNVFSVANFNNGKLNERQMLLLKDLYTRPCYKPDIYIYLQSEPMKCMERIVQRDRNCEQGIEYEYVKNIHDLHENAFQQLPTMKKFIINIENKTIHEIGKEVNYIIHKQRLIYMNEDRY